MTNLNKNFLPIAVIIAGVLIAGAFFYTKQGGSSISIEEAGEKAITFINKSIQDQGVAAFLLDVVDEGEVFRIHLKIEETEYDSYLTKSGKFLFPSGFNLEEQEPVEEVLSAQTLSNLAQCLIDSGAKFYGAYWCTFCKQQKEMFGEASSLLPYIECSDENQGMLPECQTAGITSYPTWEFNGEKSSGVKTIEELSELSGCPIQ